jgi:hypothetical protein
MNGVFTQDAVQDYGSAYRNIVTGVVPLIATMRNNFRTGASIGYS